MEKDKNIILYQTYYSTVYQYIKKKVSSEEKAIELTRDVFTELSYAAEQFDHEDLTRTDFADFCIETAEYVYLRNTTEKKNKKQEKFLIWFVGIVLGIVLFVTAFAGGPDRNMVYESSELHAIFTIAQCDWAMEVHNSGDARSVYQYTGIGDANLVKYGAIAGKDLGEEFYALFLQMHSEKDVEQIINLIKSRLDPAVVLRENTDVTIDDFTFYVNGEYLLVTYVDPELVEKGAKPSEEDMQDTFDKCVKRLRKAEKEKN